MFVTLAGGILGFVEILELLLVVSILFLCG